MKRVAVFLRRHWLAIVIGVVILVVFVAILTCVPRWMAPEVGDGVTALERTDRVNNARRTVTQIIGGLVVLLVAYLSWKRVNALEQQVAVAQQGVAIAQQGQLLLEQGQVTERFSRAIDQLGATRPDGTPNVEVRTGGIRSLERIASESPDDFWQVVVDILSGYVRHHCHVPDQGEDVSPEVEEAVTRMEVVAILAAIGRLWPDRPEPRDQRLDLRGTVLRAHGLLGEALRGATLSAVRLRGVVGNGNLRDAFLFGADLRNALFFGTDLRGANLRAADLHDANLDDIIYDDATQWPEGFTPPPSADPPSED